MNHVFAAVHPDGIGVISLILIGVAVDFGSVDEAFVVPLDEDILRPDGFSGPLYVDNEVPKVGLMVFFP